MARKTPAVKQKVSKSFSTKDGALKFSSKQREKAREAGIRKRFDVVQNISTGQWDVVEFTFSGE